MNLKEVLIHATTWTSRAGCSGHIPGASHRPRPHLAQTRQRGQDPHHPRPLLLNREGSTMPLLLTLQPPVKASERRHRHGVRAPAANCAFREAAPRSRCISSRHRFQPLPRPCPEPWFLKTFRPSAPWRAGLWVRTQAHRAPIKALLLASAASVRVLRCASVSPSAMWGQQRHLLPRLG